MYLFPSGVQGIRDITLRVYMTFEALLLTVGLQHGAVSIALLAIYRPPPSPTDQFITELSDVLERCSTYSHCYVAGDPQHTCTVGRFDVIDNCEIQPSAEELWTTGLHQTTDPR